MTRKGMRFQDIEIFLHHGFSCLEFSISQFSRSLCKPSPLALSLEIPCVVLDVMLSNAAPEDKTPLKLLDVQANHDLREEFKPVT
jgi:hypothetical protein